MRKFLLLFFLACSSGIAAQDLDSLLAAENSQNDDGPDYVSATFKSHHLINFPTNETVGERVLDFNISHRFGEFNSGAQNLFGLDGPASIRIGFNYGINSRLMATIGRSSFEKLFDGGFKYRILRQTTDNKMPLSMTYQATMNCTSQNDPNKAATGVDIYQYFTSRLSYVHTLTLARKFNSKVSLQLNGFYVHYNMVQRIEDSNDMFAAGISGRIKLTQRMAITFEYAHRLNKYSANFDSFYNPMAIGLDLETGGHVFQMHFTNAFAMNEAQFIPYTRGNPMKGGIRLGFNITRGFSVGKKEGNQW
jgi:hypothetical protein